MINLRNIHAPKHPKGTGNALTTRHNSRNMHQMIHQSLIKDSAQPLQHGLTKFMLKLPSSSQNGQFKLVKTLNINLVDEN